MRKIIMYVCFDVWNVGSDVDLEEDGFDVGI